MSDNVVFSSLDQRPTILWIGCADARVAETNVIPGTEIFVQRNVANQFNESDANAAACVAFLLNLPSVREVLVVGHTMCGGVQACHETALGRPPHLHPAILQWLAPLQQLANSFVPGNPSLNDLIKENVRRQVVNVREFVNRLPLEGHLPVEVRGAIYHIESGILERF